MSGRDCAGNLKVRARRHNAYDFHIAGRCSAGNKPPDDSEQVDFAIPTYVDGP